MKKLNIVIISNVIFPRIAPRAFRATELAKALAKKGHNVTLIASLGTYNYENFEKETSIRVKNLGNTPFDLRNSDGQIKVSLFKKAIIFFLIKLFHFPEVLLMPKVKKTILAEKNIDLLISIALPYTIHWGVSLINKKEKNFNTWVSDCGDPFMGNTVTKPYFYFKYLEKFWGRKTDFIAVPVIDAKEAYYKEVEHKIVEIPQGFDFSEIELETYKKNKITTFLYAGLFYPEKRDPTAFLSYLCTLDTEFKFIIYTSKTELLKPFINKLAGKLEIRDSVDRNVLIKEMSKVDFLINIENKGTTAQVPSKLIDYTLSKRPILEISSDFPTQEKENFDKFLLEDYSKQKIIDNFEKYNSENVADAFLKLHQLNNE